MSRVRYREEPGWELGLRAQMQDDLIERAEVASAHVHRIQEGKFMARKGVRPVRVTVAATGEVRVENTKGGWHLQEFGSTRNIVQAPLRRGTIAAGLTFVPHPPPA